MPAAGRSINVREFIDARAVSPFQWLVGFLTFVVISLDGWDTVIIGFVVPELIKEWGVTKNALAPVLSAALFGLAAGALAGGPIADRFGRKRVPVASVLVIGLGTLATAHASSLAAMLPVRFITGLGLGTVMPNVVTLQSEYVPERRRSFLVTLVHSGFTVGAALCGFIAAWIIPNHGRRTMLTVGGTLGSIAIGSLMDRFDRYRTIAESFCVAALSLWAVHGMQSTSWVLQGLAFAWGWFIPGTNTGMNALTARFYPTVARSTGLSWTHAFGRLGAIGSGFAGAVILSAGLGFGQILPIMAVAPLTGAVAVLVIAGLVNRWALADESAAPDAPSAAEVSPNS